MITVDGRCNCKKCEQRTSNTYRMIGRCSNCHTNPVLMLFREGDPALSLTCPVCKNWHTVNIQRHAEDHEIPEYASND